MLLAFLKFPFSLKDAAMFKLSVFDYVLQLCLLYLEREDKSDSGAYVTVKLRRKISTKFRGLFYFRFRTLRVM